MEEASSPPQTLTILTTLSQLTDSLNSPMGSSTFDPKTPKSEPETLESQISPNNPQNPPLMDVIDPEKEKLEDDTEQSRASEKAEEEEGECGFCLFMKAGGCRDNFISWEDCITEAEEKNEDVVEKCGQITAKLKVCMEAHQDHYAPILRAEKAAEAQVKKELEMEKEASKQQHQEASGN